MPSDKQIRSRNFGEEEKKNDPNTPNDPAQGKDQSSLTHVDEEDFTTNWEESVEKFDDLGLKEEVLRGIYGYGFVKPSPIQQKGILPIIQGKDTIA